MPIDDSNTLFSNLSRSGNIFKLYFSCCKFVQVPQYCIEHRKKSVVKFDLGKKLNELVLFIIHHANKYLPLIRSEILDKPSKTWTVEKLRHDEPVHASDPHHLPHNLLHPQHRLSSTSLFIIIYIHFHHLHSVPSYVIRHHIHPLLSSSYIKNKPLITAIA